MRITKVRMAAGMATAAASLVAFAGTALAASSPTVSTGSAIDITANTAVLQATVVPGGAQTSYSFLYGPTSALGTQSGSQSAGSGTASVAAKTTISGLLPGTVYYYRVDATNAAGQALGAIKTFKTGGSPPPGATTGAAENLSASGVTLTGVVSPQGAATTYYFNYGLTTAYGLQTAPMTVPAGTTPVAVTATIPGLQAGATFHFQLVAVHSDSLPAAGADGTFETFPSPPPVPTLTIFSTPRTVRHRPYSFVAGGHLVNPTAATPPALACTGTVDIRVMYGHRTIASTVAGVQPDCTYGGAIVLHTLPAQSTRGKGRKHKRAPVKLDVVAQFLGNNYLAGALSKGTQITFG
jgi:hypothetical protein